MKNECDVVKDLLPSYAEDLLSDNTNQFVKEHLDSCQECRKVYDGMKKINYNNIHSAADILLCHFAYIYDYNFSTMLKFVDSKGYIDKMYNRFSFEDDITEERYKNIYLHTKTYIKKKTG